MDFVHTFAHCFRSFSIFSLFFQTCFYENVYVVMANVKKNQGIPNRFPSNLICPEADCFTLFLI